MAASDYSPEHLGHSPLERPTYESVGSVFHIGDTSQSYDVIQDGHRIFLWEKSEDDAMLARVAGWQRFTKQGEAGDFSRLEVPEGTRSARSILSGLEAWGGEKAEALNFLGRYTQVVQQVSGGKVDVSVSLATVARTKKREFFITPPHNLVDDPVLIDVWQRKVVDEAQTVLLAEDNREALIAKLIIDIANYEGHA